MFGRFCQAHELAAGDVRAVATAPSATPPTATSCSTRRAERTGLRIEVLSEAEEARYGYLAAVNTTTLSDGAVVDLGGGSLQLVAVADRPRARRRLAAARRGAADRAVPARDGQGDGQGDEAPAQPRR